MNLRNGSNAELVKAEPQIAEVESVAMYTGYNDPLKQRATPKSRTEHLVHLTPLLHKISAAQ